MWSFRCAAYPDMEKNSFFILPVISMSESRDLTNKEQRMARKAQRQKEREESTNKSKKRSCLDEEEKGQDSVDFNQTDDSRVEHREHESDEVEAISHKEQRKRRKMEKYMSQHSEGDVNTRPSKPQRSPYSVWIGNLAFSTSVKELTEWLQEQGIEGISRVHMISGVRREEHNRGFAYVDLPSQDQVERCIALSESELKGRNLLIKGGTDFRGRPGLDPKAAELGSDANHGRTGLSKTAQRILRSQKNPPAPTLFLGNLSFETKESDIYDLLEGSAQKRYEETATSDESGVSASAGIRKIRMGTFEDSGKCKGFAFVDFDSASLATKALIEPRNGRLLGRLLQIEFASSDAVRRGASKDLLPDYVPERRRRRSRSTFNDEDTKENALEEQDHDAAQEDNHTAPRRPGASRAPRRVRPGAANASAPRQNYGIVPSEGKRTTFE